jgi:hypothetical protein
VIQVAANTKKRPQRENTEDQPVRRIIVRKYVVHEFTWVIPDDVEKERAQAYADDVGEVYADSIATLDERWVVEEESKSDVVRRLTRRGMTASEIAKVTGWDYTFVYGVGWRDGSPRALRGVRNGTGVRKGAS